MIYGYVFTGNADLYTVVSHVHGTGVFTLVLPGHIHNVQRVSPSNVIFSSISQGVVVNRNNVSISDRNLRGYIKAMTKIMKTARILANEFYLRRYEQVYDICEIIITKEVFYWSGLLTCLLHCSCSQLSWLPDTTQGTERLVPRRAETLAGGGSTMVAWNTAPRGATTSSELYTPGWENIPYSVSI